jgi:hypothetical protein
VPAAPVVRVAGAVPVAALAMPLAVPAVPGHWRFLAVRVVLRLIPLAVAAVAAVGATAMEAATQATIT